MRLGKIPIGFLQGRHIRVTCGKDERVAYVVLDDLSSGYLKVRFWVNARREWDLGPKSGYSLPRARVLGLLPKGDKRRRSIYFERKKWTAPTPVSAPTTLDDLARYNLQDAIMSTHLRTPVWPLMRHWRIAHAG
jgi:hypothetical protein